jgi:hypothetical protein
LAPLSSFSTAFTDTTPSPSSFLSSAENLPIAAGLDDFCPFVMLKNEEIFVTRDDVVSLGGFGSSQNISVIRVATD